ncbi:hypothetical protein [Methylobacterium oxalidis]|uniref:Uncharacterized protein n=1 Tax=Methylobacterium oxalidis TaxID=944322 RepID=A0A512J4S9_9HYPH|nr:hypothetical protein [Methylobacterium oxalidis]GEP04961.1 hypothetical protein MOX02_29990 [Methylobacterium oxalidis]GJE35537.1 hypothetical protein LDDCCGHA_5756 [Methylobacterium oxalidis]GLS63698.1 hypothetical protein GCM10007888_20790 [Methylobacterium oxalidis]
MPSAPGLTAALLGALAGAWLGALLPARAAPLEADSACGGNAYSSAQVVEGRPPRRGPLTATPDTLCADLAGPRPSVRIDIYGVPGLSGGGGTGAEGSGGTGEAAPYEAPPPRGARSPVPRHRGY